MQDGAKKRPKLEPDPATAPVVERMYRMADAGKSILDIAKTLNNEGIARSKGKLWSKTVVHSILTSETYTGTLVWGLQDKDKADPVQVENAFPAHRIQGPIPQGGRAAALPRALPGPPPPGVLVPTC